LQYHIADCLIIRRCSFVGIGFFMQTMRLMRFSLLLVLFLFSSCGSISQSDPVCFARMESDAEWSVPEPFLFDAEGNAIDFRNAENPGCSAPLSDFIANLRQNQIPAKCSLENMASFTRSIHKTPCGDSAFVVPDADYHLFITWATWTGKLVYRQRVHEWLDAAHHNAQARIAVYLVNMDQVVCR
jgi:hypothetical protein